MLGSKSSMTKILCCSSVKDFIHFAGYIKTVLFIIFSEKLDFSAVNLRAIYIPLITKFTPPLLQSLQRENNVYRLKYISLWNILTHIYISILFISDRLPQCFQHKFLFCFHNHYKWYEVYSNTFAKFAESNVYRPKTSFAAG